MLDDPTWRFEKRWTPRADVHTACQQCGETVTAFVVGSVATWQPIPSGLVVPAGRRETQVLLPCEHEAGLLVWTDATYEVIEEQIASELGGAS